MNLNGKVAIITGPKGGLGGSVTKTFLEAGANVAGVSRSIRDTDFPDPAFAAFEAEISSGAAAREVTQRVLARWGRVDIFVHLVGGFAGGQSVADADDAVLNQMLDVNLRQAFHWMRAVLAPMRDQGGGRILVIGSRTASDPAAMLGAYSASKAALISVVRTVALENKDRGVTANVVVPSTIDTPANRAAQPLADPSKWVQPRQLADLLAHLASDAASQINGAVIPVYGGEL
jgi:NAD(P)-dependent dehydrogenase (short-subunit alcohol dehydrogenase family)